MSLALDECDVHFFLSYFNFNPQVTIFSSFFMSSSVEFSGGRFAIVELIGRFKKMFLQITSGIFDLRLPRFQSRDVTPSLPVIFPSVVVTPKPAFHYFFNAEQSKSYGIHAF